MIKHVDFLNIATDCIVYYLGSPALHRGVMVSPIDYPSFVVNYDLTIFPDTSRLRISTQTKDISMDLPSSLI